MLHGYIKLLLLTHHKEVVYILSTHPPPNSATRRRPKGLNKAWNRLATLYEIVNHLILSGMLIW